MLEEDDEPLDLRRINSQEIMFIPNILGAAEIHIALGEGKQLKSKLNDAFCEQLVLPCLFLKGKFGYRTSNEVKHSPVKFFNQ